MEDNAPHMQKSTVVVYVVIVALVVMVVWQQQQIGQIRNGQTGIGTISNTGMASQNQPAFNRIKAIKDSLLTTRTVSGAVVSSTASAVVVKANLVNLTALDTFDFKVSQVLPFLSKNLTISITKNTTVSGKLVAGVAVSVQTKEPVYGGGALTAVSISALVPPKATAVPPTTK